MTRTFQSTADQALTMQLVAELEALIAEAKQGKHQARPVENELLVAMGEIVGLATADAGHQGGTDRMAA
jgi:transposase